MMDLPVPGPYSILVRVEPVNSYIAKHRSTKSISKDVIKHESGRRLMIWDLGLDALP
jgi:hypothetical protein